MKKDAEVMVTICLLLTYSMNKKRSCLCFVPYRCDEVPWQNQQGRQGLFLCTVQQSSPSWWRGGGHSRRRLRTGHPAFVVKEQRAVDAYSQTVFFFLYSPG